MTRWLPLAAALGTSLVSCGSRTTFDAQDGPPSPPECLQDRDCPDFGDRCFPVACIAGACQQGAPVDCDDRDVCTLDTCDAATGKCAHEPSTLDLDRDGHPSPLPGKRAGEPDSCGDDCDDRNASARPGGLEICDGVDNDCNGVVDDNAALTAVGEGVRISEADKASVGSLSYPGGANYLATYSGDTGTSAIYAAILAANGQRVGSSTRFTPGPADAQDSTAVWTGDRFGVAWADRREAVGRTNYEIYFNLANFDGTKRGADVRVTNVEGFSINESIAWTGNEFALTWQDDGFDLLGRNRVYGQRIGVDGQLVGPRISLSDRVDDGQTAPAIAAGPRSIGVLWTQQRGGGHDLMFTVYDHQLRPLTSPTALTDGMSQSDAPAITYNASQFVIAWHDDRAGVRQIFGTVRDDLGNEVVAAKQLTTGPNVARYPDLLPYGDRVLLVWSDTRDDPNSWEIYAKTLTPTLDTLTAEQRLTRSRGESLTPVASFGPNGEVGILYSDNTAGERQVYFTRLACNARSTPRGSP